MSGAGAEGQTSGNEHACLRNRLAALQRRIADAAQRSGRQPTEVGVLIATKTQDASRVAAAVEVARRLGITRLSLGENRAREGRDKALALAGLDIPWSMIGHVQSNKVEEVVAFASEVQSLDRLSLAEALDRRLQKAGRGIDVLVQVNTSGEPSKFGLEPNAVVRFLSELTAFHALRVRGLMTLAALGPDESIVRGCFRRLREVRQACRDGAPQGSAVTELSMGMSGDLGLAVEEGATMVRPGEAVFGPRASAPAGGWWPEPSITDRGQVDSREA